MSTRSTIYAPDSSPRLHVFYEMNDDRVHVVNETDTRDYDDEVVLTLAEARELAAAILADRHVTADKS